MTNAVQGRVEKLRGLLKAQNISAYVVPSSDPHQSEYVAPKWGRREYISGFTGSAGLFAMNDKEAGLWTDGRYFEQAETELNGSSINLFKQGLEGVPDWQEWMIQTLPKGSRVGINPDLFSTQAYQKISGNFGKAGLDLVAVADDFVDQVWSKDRPELPSETFYAHPMAYAGESHEAKLTRLRSALSKEGAKAIVVSALDEIAWLFNLRGRDVPNNPVFYAYAVVSDGSAELFTELSKLDESLKKSLGSAVTLRPYDDFRSSLKSLKGPVWIDPNSTSAAVESVLKENGIAVVAKDSPIPAWKAVKNSAELKGMREAHVRDGVAMVRFSRWLKDTIGREKMDEMSVADKLESFRKKAKEFRGPSFSTISGYGPHGALPHYRASNESNSEIFAKGIFLLDSGAQYDDGTTDITRTYALGKPSDQHRFIYTTVLKGHLLLGRSLFPKGTNGYQLDTVARQPIWQEALDYNHGTGHGVGAALCVHEGPFSVSLRKNMTPLEAGHVLSNEPACYLPGDFGVRIENLVTVVEKTKNSFGSYLGLEDLTLCPYERELIDTGRLSSEDIKQVNAYHARVRAELSPLLEGKDLEYLLTATEKLS
ncbi:MAG: aminopeptidase P family protein [Proteobacteria bacterium]|nr:MAG: aminopeptidase P family protein [Pseudomonadota bacterium]